MTTPTATTIMIIRHGEKPAGDTAPFGVAEDGTPGDDQGRKELIVRGWVRAGALVPFFAPHRDPLNRPALPTPQHLFACKLGGKDSRRPHDTLLPLSRKLRVPIDVAYGQDDFAAMTEDAMGRTGVVLICWEHRRIQHITALLPRHGHEPPDAYSWPEARYDVVFVFELDGDKYRFSQVPEVLLDGDIETGIDTTVVKGDDD